MMNDFIVKKVWYFITVIYLAIFGITMRVIEYVFIYIADPIQ